MESLKQEITRICFDIDNKENVYIFMILINIKNDD